MNICNYLCVCLHVDMSEDSLKLGSQLVVRYLMWMLEAELSPLKEQPALFHLLRLPYLKKLTPVWEHKQPASCHLPSLKKIDSPFLNSHLR